MDNEQSTLDATLLETVAGFNLDQRLQYLLKEVIKHQQLWILTDEHGCVMLNTDDEDCVPIWPLQAFAEQFATGDWQTCKAEAISIEKWQSHWTPGLLDDELSLVVFPSIDDEGQVLYPDEFEDILLKQIKNTQAK